MAGNLKQLDPVDGLYNYILDVKPYHTKIVEILTEYVHLDKGDVTILDIANWDINVNIPRVSLATQDYCGGYEYRAFGDPYNILISSPSPTSDFINGFKPGTNGTGQISVQGDVTKFFKQHDNINIVATNDDGNVDFNLLPSIPYTIASIEFVEGSIDSWPDPSDPTTYVSGDLPHTVITLVEDLTINAGTNPYVGVIRLEQIPIIEYGTNEIFLLGDYTHRFKNGDIIEGIGGDYINGKRYNIVFVEYVNGMTKLHIFERLFNVNTGYPVNKAPLNEFELIGDQTAFFSIGNHLICKYSLSNDGFYQIQNVIFDNANNVTRIDVGATLANERSGELYPINNLGFIQEYLLGYGESKDLCPAPESQVKVKFEELFNIQVVTKLGESMWGFEFPTNTIISGTEPIIATNEPSNPNINDLWFDSPFLKQWNGSEWIEVVTVYWADTSTNRLMSLTKTQYQDTGWIIKYNTLPGFNNQILSTDNNSITQWFFATVDDNGIVSNIFTTSTSVPNLDPSNVQVQVNQIPGTFNVITANEIQITSPVIFENDIIQINISIDQSGANAFLGDWGYPESPFQVSANITDGLDFNITDTAGSEMFRYAIQSIDYNANQITILGDGTVIQPNQTITVFGPDGIDQDYTVINVGGYNGGVTVLDVSNINNNSNQTWIEGYIQ